MGNQLITPILAAHYRVMPGQQQLQQQKIWVSNSSSSNGSSGSGSAADGRTFVGFSFNTGLGDAELLFYEFAGEWLAHVFVFFWQSRA